MPCRYRHSGPLPLPISWILDGYPDCVDGEDERGEGWPTCLVKDSTRFIGNEQDCDDVFVCGDDVRKTVTFEALCHGVASCSEEGQTCEATRSAQIRNIQTFTLNSDVLRKNLLHCVPGFENSFLPYFSGCQVQEFMYPRMEVFGLTRTILFLPSSPIDCSNTFGEIFVYLSCQGKCLNISCPLKETLTYNSCSKNNLKDRSYTVSDNHTLTFVQHLPQYHLFQNQLFLCDNDLCISFDKVCNLIDDCGDSSDETRCVNHFKCRTTGDLILATQKCDGNVDCLDFSDECNDKCGKHIISFLLLKVLAWVIGVIAIVLNLIKLFTNARSVWASNSKVVLINKTFMLVINAGDLITGCYILAIAVVDTIVYGEAYCTERTAWLASTPCAILGAFNVIGVQISLFAMTFLSFYRLQGIMSLRGRGDGNLKVKLPLCIVLITVTSIFIGCFPLVPQLEDYFVNGMSYRPEIRLFVAMVNKDTHLNVLEAYYQNIRKITSLKWAQINDLVDDMFTASYGGIGRKKIHFYGNAGVCLFKYFVSSTDPQKAFVWSNLTVNLACFGIIAICYVMINVTSRRSTLTIKRMMNGKGALAQMDRRNRRTQRNIALIIMTDFVCW